MISLLGEHKLNFMLSQLELTKSIEGDVIEVGVYEGGALFEMAKIASQWPKVLNNQSKIYGFDTFEGLPEQSSDDVHQIGEFRASHTQVAKLLKDHNVELVIGIYPNTANHNMVSFCHLDVDQYNSTKNSLEFLKNKISSNGLIVMDDYKWKNCPGVERALHEFLSENGDFKISATNTHQAVVKKC